MARRQAPFTQAEITRLIKAALAAGISEENIAGVKVTRDGATLMFGERPQAVAGAINEWDEVLTK